MSVGTPPANKVTQRKLQWKIRVSSVVGSLNEVTLGRNLDTRVLYRPVGQKELDLIGASGFKEFPPRLPGQPFFYPVLNEQYATQIARDWNTRDPKSDYTGYVLRFSVEARFLDRHQVHVVGTSSHCEYWIPAEELAEFNSHIIGPIEIVAQFFKCES
jgi:hypothetical protein